MTGFEELAVFWLAFSFGIHIVLVNLGIGISVMAPTLKAAAGRLGRPELEEEAYRLLRFYAATYALGGVFGTAFTVYLLSFYPSFVALLGKMALYNFALAIAMIALHFLSLTVYYYGWGRLEPRTHSAFGALLAVSALLIPLGFRSVFAQLNSPVGIEILGREAIRVDVVEALLGNPTLPPLYAKSIAASIALTAVAAAAWASLRGRYSLASVYLKPALASLIAVALSGAWYAWSLRGVEYKFNNIFGGLGLGGEPQLDLSWLLLLKVALWLVQVVAVSYAVVRGVRGAKAPLVAAAASALLAVPAGEMLNAFSQYPYFIADTGLLESMLSQLPPEEAESLRRALTLLEVNAATRSGVLHLYTIVATTVLLAAAALYAYIALYRERR